MSGFVRRLAEPVTAGALARRLAQTTIVDGDPGRAIDGVAALSTAVAGTLTFCDGTRPAELLASTAASVVIVAADADTTSTAQRTLLRVDDARAGFIEAVALLLPGIGRPGEPAPGVAADTRVDAGAEIAPTACVGAHVRIGAGSRIGAGAVIYEGCRLGANVCVGPGAVVGWVGLAYHDTRDGRRLFFPHLAGVHIGDRVDIGANACVCRGMLSDTVIDDDVKIGSLVYVSHGVVVEAGAWLSASVAIAGHSTVGARAVIGIGSVVVDNVTLAPGTIVGGGSVVTKAADRGAKLFGTPARQIPTMRRFGPTPRE